MSELCATDGFISRIPAEGEDGSWTDHAKWTTADAAHAAMLPASAGRGSLHDESNQKTDLNTIVAF
jgi:hypothetical protein